MTRDQIFHDLILLSQLIDMNISNDTELERIQSVLDMNNITAMTALESVRTNTFLTIWVEIWCPTPQLLIPVFPFLCASR
jgi:hypothetical protein